MTCKKKAGVPVAKMEALCLFCSRFFGFCWCFAKRVPNYKSTKLLKLKSDLLITPQCTVSSGTSGIGVDG